MPNTFEEYDQLFYNDGYQLGKGALKEENDEQHLSTAISEMYAAIDQLNESLELAAQKQGHPVHCQKGCSWCCHQPVFANTYELNYLADFIRTHFSEKEIEGVIAKAKTKNAISSKLGREKLLNNKMPCPLLKDGACSVYEARPMACRIYLSTDVSTCLEFYNNPQNEKSFPALLDFPLHAGRMMNEGFMKALSEAGVETEEFRLEEGLIDLKEDNKRY